MRLIMLCLLVMFNAPAWADWEKIYESPDFTYFVDPETVRKMGDLRLASSMRDLKKPATGGEISRRAIVEYDCKEGRRRLLSLTTYAGPMATGNVLVNLNKASAWDYISDGATASSTLKFVCAWKS